MIGVGWREGKEGRHEKKWKIFAPSKRRRGGCRKLNWILQQWKLCTVSMIDCMSEVNFSAKLGLHKSFVYLFRSEVELQSKRTITLQPKVWSLELYGLLHAACCLVCFIHFFHFLAFILWNKKCPSINHRFDVNMYLIKNFGLYFYELCHFDEPIGRV